MFLSNCIVKKYARNRKRAACVFFRSAKTVFITRNVNAPLYDGHPNRRIGERPAYRCFLTRASMGKSNYYDKMK